jgi:SNW domain-containing protein 1
MLPACERARHVTAHPPPPACTTTHQEQTISDKFASLSEALQVAESKAREATEMRKQVALEMARRQKMAKDEQLRKLAQQARMERGGPLAAAGGGLAGRDTAAVGALPPLPGPPGGGYPGPPPPPAAAGGAGHRGGGGGRRSPGSSSDEEAARRRHGSSRGRERGSDGGYDDDEGRRGRDEYEETPQVSARQGCRGCVRVCVCVVWGVCAPALAAGGVSTLCAGNNR